MARKRSRGASGRSGPPHKTPSRGTPARTTASYGKELYDLLAGSLLKVTLVVALCAWVLHLGVSALAGLVGVELSELWELAEELLGVRSSLVRLVVFAPLHLALFVLSYRPLRRLMSEIGARVELLWTRLEKQPQAKAWNKTWTQLDKTHGPPVRRALGLAFTAVTTLLLVVFLLQPTLVPLRLDRRAWLDRAANLVDGTASAYLVDSIVGAARWFYAEPAEGIEAVTADAFAATLDSESVPLMDRWDRYLLEAAEGDRELFAKTKAFMWVETGGRQFALSATGCAGLMQFCASTAQRRPFHGIFGVGQVAACGCDDCSVPRPVQIELETDATAAARHKDTFPCNLSDARFDARRSIEAGVAYVRELSDKSGGHLPLMYVGYNSGPAIAASLHRTLGPQEELTLDELRPHLANALRPYYGKRAEPRANGLLEVHLPKLMAAYERWR
jgi:hypothetical protein